MIKNNGFEIFFIALGYIYNGHKFGENLTQLENRILIRLKHLDPDPQSQRLRANVSRADARLGL